MHRLIGPQEGVRSALAVRLRQKRAEIKHIGRWGEALHCPIAVVRDRPDWFEYVAAQPVKWSQTGQNPPFVRCCQFSN